MIHPVKIICDHVFFFWGGGRACFLPGHMVASVHSRVFKMNSPFYSVALKIDPFWDLENETWCPD